MIRDLNAKVEGKKSTPKDFSPVPKGKYLVEVNEIKPWKATTKNIQVIVKDKKGYPVKEKGKNKKELVKDFTYYNAQLSFKIIEDDYKGRLIFDNLTTHPNADFYLENFIYAIRLDEVALNQLQNKAKGLKLTITVDINEEAYKYEVNDVTGQKKKVISPKNEVKNYLRVDLNSQDGEKNSVEGL